MGVPCHWKRALKVSGVGGSECGIVVDVRMNVLRARSMCDMYWVRVVLPTLEVLSHHLSIRACRCVRAYADVSAVFCVPFAYRRSAGGIPEFDSAIPRASNDTW